MACDLALGNFSSVTALNRFIVRNCDRFQRRLKTELRFAHRRIVILRSFPSPAVLRAHHLWGRKNERDLAIRQDVEKSFFSERYEYNQQKLGAPKEPSSSMKRTTQVPTENTTNPKTRRRPNYRRISRGQFSLLTLRLLPRREQTPSALSEQPGSVLEPQHRASSACEELRDGMRRERQQQQQQRLRERPSLSYSPSLIPWQMPNLASHVRGYRNIGTELHRRMGNFSTASPQRDSADNRRKDDQPLNTLHGLLS